MSDSTPTPERRDGMLRAMVPWRDPSEHLAKHLLRCVFQFMPVIVVVGSALLVMREVVRWAL